MISVCLYSKEQREEWNGFVAASKNGTFLFDRGFMDYHADRFVDASLVFRDGRGRVCGLLPANYDAASQVVLSHGGLTYGGLVLGSRAVQSSVGEMLALAAGFYRLQCNALQLVYKPVPGIYHSYPAEEDLYALHSMGAVLKWRAVSSAMPPAAHLPFRKGRKACVAKARREGITVRRASDAVSVRRFHALLTDCLLKRHGVAPVHSLDEMCLLMERFPCNISLYVAERGGEMYAGAWMFESHNVAHTQYLANSDAGRRIGAEDILLAYLIDEAFVSRRYFDFGISTENNGTYLNENLISLKEGFGARSVCYDTYVLDLQRPNRARCEEF